MKKPLLIAFTLLSLVLLTAFFLQNRDIIEFRYLLWSFEGSIAVISLLFFLFGLIMGTLWFMRNLLGLRKSNHSLNEQIGILMKEKVQASKQIDELTNKLATAIHPPETDTSSENDPKNNPDYNKYRSIK